MTDLSQSTRAPRRALPWARRARTHRGGIPLFWVLPGLVLVVALHYVAVAAGGWYAFTNWDGISVSAHWIGLDNFRELVNDQTARGALVHSVELTAVFVVVVNAIGLALALALHRTVKSRNVLRSLFFAPFVLSPLATAYIWRFIFDYDGPFNGLLSIVGLRGVQRTWLGDPTWALWTILVVMVWQMAGLVMSFFLAGLQGIPEELEEAAVVDGASLWLRVRAITLPMLAPAITISITLTTIQGLRVFDIVMALTAGGPGGATETLSTELFKQGFAASRYGYGAAFALVLTLFIAVATIVQLGLLRRREARL